MAEWWTFLGSKFADWIYSRPKHFSPRIAMNIDTAHSMRFITSSMSVLQINLSMYDSHTKSIPEFLLWSLLCRLFSVKNVFRSIVIIYLFIWWIVGFVKMSSNDLTNRDLMRQEFCKIWHSTNHKFGQKMIQRFVIWSRCIALTDDVKNRSSQVCFLGKSFNKEFMLNAICFVCCQALIRYNWFGIPCCPNENKSNSRWKNLFC